MTPRGIPRAVLVSRLDYLVRALGDHLKAGEYPRAIELLSEAQNVLQQVREAS